MDTWDDKTTGEKRSKIKVQAERVQFLDRRGDVGGRGARQDDGHAPPAARDSQPRRGGPPSEGRGPSNGPARRLSGPGQRAQPTPPADPDRTRTTSRSDAELRDRTADRRAIRLDPSRADRARICDRLSGGLDCATPARLTSGVSASWPR